MSRKVLTAAAGQSAGGSGLPANFFYELPRTQQVSFGTSSRPTTPYKTLFVRQSDTQYAIAQLGYNSTFYRLWSQPWQVSGTGVVTLGSETVSDLASGAIAQSTTSGLDIGGGRGAFVGMLQNSSSQWTQSSAGVTVNANNTVTLGLAFQGQYSATTNNQYLWPNTPTLAPCGNSGFFAVGGYNQSGHPGVNYYSFSSGTTPTYQNNGLQFAQSSSYQASCVPAMQAWNDTSSRESLVHASVNTSYAGQIRYYSLAGNTSSTYVGQAEDLFGFAGLVGYHYSVGLRLGTKCVYLIDACSAIVTDGTGTVATTKVATIGHKRGDLSSLGYGLTPLGGGYFFNNGELYHISVNAGNTLVTVRFIAAFRAGTGLPGLTTPFTNDQVGSSGAYWSTVNNNNILVIATASGVSTYDFTKVKQLMIY